MTALIIDQRIAFKSTVRLEGPTAIVSAAVFGGPIILLQVAVFDAQDQLLDGVGFDGHGPAITSEQTGTASWLFVPKANASYVKWGVVAMRSAAGLGGFSVTAKVRNSAGDALATGQFSAKIDDGVFSADVIYDGVMLDRSMVKTAMLAGAKV